MEFVPDELGLDELAETVIISIVWKPGESIDATFTGCSTFEAADICRNVSTVLTRYNLTTISISGLIDEDDDDE